MPSVTKSVTLPGTPEEAFALASDPARFGEWLTIHADWPGGVPEVAEGAEFTQKITIMGMPADVNWRVEELSSTRSVMKGAGPMGAQLSTTISAAPGDGGSEVSYEAEFSGGGIQGPMGEMVTQKTGEAVEASLAKLKEIAG